MATIIRRGPFGGVRVASIERLRIVDLSQEIDPSTQMFPSYPQVTFVPWTRMPVHPFTSEAMFLATHTGTHVDAPCHFIPGGKQLHELPASRFVLRCHLLDLGRRKAKESIGAKAVRKALGELPGRAREGDAVLLKTHWEECRGDQAYLFQNPGLTGDGARVLAELGVSLVGVDTANLDHPDDASFPAHTTLLKREIVVLENACNLGKLTEATFTLVALPLNLQGTTGSPVRAVALLD